MTIMLMCYREPRRFVVNRPFYFALVDKKLKIVAFNGRVQNPRN